jgi:diguanylate cyclase (GGDEF)-like protein
LSVIHLFVVVALLPMLPLPVLSGILARERLREAATASDVERTVEAVMAMDHLRKVAIEEKAIATLSTFAACFDMPLSLFTDAAGWHVRSVAEAEAVTNAAFTTLPPAARVDAVLRLRTDLPSIRASLRKADALGCRSASATAAALVSYESDVELIAGAERTLAREVSDRAEGTSGAKLLASIRSFEAVCTLAIIKVQHIVSFTHYLMTGSTSVADKASMSRLARQFEVLSIESDDALGPQRTRAWHELISSAPFRKLETTLAKGETAVPGLDATALGSGRISAATAAAVLDAASTLTASLDQLSSFLMDAARDAATVARTDAAAARRRATLALGGVGAVVALTTIALWGIGGVLRRRLNRLTLGAERLSAGLLEPLAVQGPRELAATGRALNAAVATLRHVRAKAEILAQGELDSPQLEEAAPGPLAAAVDASMTRIVTAVRERAEIQLRLAHEADHDTLTGLPNRALLHRELNASADRATQDATAISVLFIDLDKFKDCNDRFGHAAGDHVLRVTAQRLLHAVRAGDLVARLGGDEFVVVSQGAPPGPDTVRLGERIVAAVSQPITYEGQSISIGASVGLSGCDHGQATAEQLLHQADGAVYRAKASGRGLVVVYDGELLVDETSPH